jgi:hypothetical protein
MHNLNSENSCGGLSLFYQLFKNDTQFTKSHFPKTKYELWLLYMEHLKKKYSILKKRTEALTKICPRVVFRCHLWSVNLSNRNLIPKITEHSNL